MHFQIILVLGLIFASGLFAQNNINSPINIKADRFELNIQEEGVNAIGNVVVTQDDVVITSEWALYNKILQIVQMYGNVKLTKQGTVLKADRIKVLGFDKVVEAYNNVTVVSQESNASAGFARYNLDTEIVLMRDKPTIFQNKDFLQGDEIKIDIKTQKVATWGDSVIFISNKTLQKK